MHKTLFVSLIFLLICQSVFSSSPDTVDRILKGKGILDYEILEQREEESFDGKEFSIVVKLKVSDDIYHIASKGKDRKEAEKKLEKEISDSFKYQNLNNDDKFRLTYVFKSSYSAITDRPVKRGKLFHAVGEDGSKYGLLVSRAQRLDNIVEFDSLWMDDLSPGLLLKETGGNLLSLFFSVSSPDAAGFNIGLEYKAFTNIYPFFPKTSISFQKTASGYSYLFSLGVGYDLFFSVFSENAVRFIKNSALSSSISIKTGFNDRKFFLIGSEFEIGYIYNFSSFFNLGIGFKTRSLLSQETDYDVIMKSGQFFVKGGIRF